MLTNFLKTAVIENPEDVAPILDLLNIIDED